MVEMCKECKYWEQTSPTLEYGMCLQITAYHPPGGKDDKVWIEVWDEAPVCVMTMPDFGCVLFKVEE